MELDPFALRYHLRDRFLNIGDGTILLTSHDVYYVKLNLATHRMHQKAKHQKANQSPHLLT